MLAIKEHQPPPVPVQALVFYKRVQELPDYNNTELWSKIAECQKALGNPQGLVSMYEGVMQDEHCPAWKQNEAALALAQLHLDTGATLAAQQVLSILKQPGGALDGTEQQGGTAGQQAHTLFHRAGLMLRLGQQVCCCFVSCDCYCCCPVAAARLENLVEAIGLKGCKPGRFLLTSIFFCLCGFLYSMQYLETGTITSLRTKHSMQSELCHPAHGVPITWCYILYYMLYIYIYYTTCYIYYIICDMSIYSMQDEFLELMLPVVAATIRQADERGEGQADPAAALDPSVAKALRRRQRGASRKKVFAEADTVFKVPPTSSDWALV